MVGVTHQTIVNEDQIVKQQAIKQDEKVEISLILGKKSNGHNLSLGTFNFRYYPSH